MSNDEVLNHYYGKDIETLYSMYYSGEGEDSADYYVLSSDMLQAEMEASARKYGGQLVNGKYSQYLFDSVASEWTDITISIDDMVMNLKKYKHFSGMLLRHLDNFVEDKKLI